MSHRVVLFSAAAALLAAAAPSALAAGKTQRVSVNSAEQPANSDSYGAAVSGGGRYVAFWSAASNLVPGDTNGASDLFVRDRKTGTTVRASLGPDGAQANAESYEALISRDGRFVVFTSRATNLVPNVSGPDSQIFRRDLLEGKTALVTVAADGGPAKGEVYPMAVSGDGRYVLFTSNATNLVPGGGEHFDIFLRDLQSWVTTVESRGLGGQPANADSFFGSISADGRYVVIGSDATNIVEEDVHGEGGAYRRDRQTGKTVLVSRTGDGRPAGGGNPKVSDDGNVVAFQSTSRSLGLDGPDGDSQVFVRDIKAGTTERVTVATDGADPDFSCDLTAVSGDGNRVAFGSRASNLVPGDTNGATDVFVRDRTARTTVRATVRTSGKQSRTDSGIWSALSGNGRVVAFLSFAALVPDDSGTSSSDVYVHVIPATP